MRQAGLEHFQSNNKKLEVCAKGRFDSSEFARNCILNSITSLEILENHNQLYKRVSV